MTSKKKYILIIIAFIILVLALVFTKSIIPTGEGGNLLQNGDFEKWIGNRPSNWTVYDYEKEFEFKGDVSDYYSVTEEDNKVLLIENKVGNDLRFRQWVAVEPSTTYKISARIKVDGKINGGDAANFSIINNSIRLGSSITNNTNSEWTDVIVYGTTGEEQEELEFAIGLGGYGSTSSGKIWVDDVRFERAEVVPEGATVEQFFSTNKEEDVHKNIIPPLVDNIIFVVLVGLLIFYIYMMVRKKKQKNNAPDKEESNDIEFDEKSKVADSTEYNEKSKDDKKYEFDEKKDWRPGQKLLTKGDAIIMTVMTVLYLLVALYNLGDMIAPQTYYAPKKYDDYVTVAFDEPKELGRVLYNSNIPKNTNEDIVSYELQYLNSEGEFENLGKIKEKAFYEWMYLDTKVTTTQVKIKLTNSGLPLNEVGFLEADSTGELGYKVIENFEIIDTNVTENEFDKWFDEQYTVPIRPSVLNGTYFDEIYFPRTAYEHLNNLPIYETTHPPLGKIIQAIGIAIFDMTPFGWRIMGTLFGAAMIPVIYAFAKKLFNKSSYAFIAAFLLMFDTMHFAQTRLATIDSYATLFIMLMYYFMYNFFVTKSYEHKLKYTLIPLFFSGLFFGLGAATKWICLYTGLGLAIVFFLSWFLEMDSHNELAVENPELKSDPEYKKYWSRNVNITFWSAVLFFVVIPFIIYTLSYIPYVRVDGVTGNIFEVTWSNQKSMLSYHSDLTAPHGYSSEWFTWPLVIRPIWYYNGTALPAGIRATIASFGNPFVWVTGIICLVAAMYIAYKKKDKKMIIVFVAFACQFLPWILVTRATFIYHYFSCVPFIILCTVYVIKHLVDTKVIGRKTVGFYLILVALFFIVFYPAISGTPVPEGYIEKLRILPSWYF